MLRSFGPEADLTLFAQDELRCSSLGAKAHLRHDIPRTLRVHTRGRFAAPMSLPTAKLRRLPLVFDEAPPAPQVLTCQVSTA